MMPMHPDLLEQVGHTFPQKANAKILRAACSVQNFNNWTLSGQVLKYSVFCS